MSERLPAYNADYFVDREDEINLIKTKIESLRDGKPVKKRTVLFLGARGVGKSWLLLHLHRTIIPQMGSDKVASLYIDFTGLYAGKGSNDNECNAAFVQTETPYQTALHKLLRDMARALSTTENEDANLQDQAAWVLYRLEALTAEAPFILLLDDVFSAPTGFLELFEEHFLKSVASLPRALIVMSGRDAAHNWIAPELYLDVERRVLSAFRKEDVEQAIAQYGGEKMDADETFQASKGFPYTVYLMATEEGDVEKVIEHLLGFIEDDEERTKIRRYIEALCVLNIEMEKEGEGENESKEKEIVGFREAEMAQLLNAYEAIGEESKYDTAQARRIREKLMQKRLLHWDSRVAGYVLDDALRHHVEYFLKTQKPELWRRLHKAAADMYRDLAKTYPTYEETFEQLAKAHEAMSLQAVSVP